MKKTILFLCGGKSEEHEISLVSCKGVLDALDRDRFQPLVVGISKRGVWHLEDEKTFFLGELRADRIRLNESAPVVTLSPYSTLTGSGRLEAEGKVFEFDAVFPVLHGTFGEDGTMQGLLDIVGVPYVGPGCGSYWICMDKVLAKTLCVQGGVAVAPFVWVTRENQIDDKMDDIRAMGLPLFVKPACQGSSVGVSRVTSLDGLSTAVRTALKHDRKCLIERGIAGREIECAVLGLNGTPRASMPGEVRPSPKIGWYSYEAKYLLSDGAEILIPAPLEPEIRTKIQEFACRVFQLLECDGMARIDLFLEHGTGKLFLNEANTIPGFTPISMYPKMWQASGLGYSDLITELIRLAFLRAGKTI